MAVPGSGAIRVSPLGSGAVRYCSLRRPRFMAGRTNEWLHMEVIRDGRHRPRFFGGRAAEDEEAGRPSTSAADAALAATDATSTELQAAEAEKPVSDKRLALWGWCLHGRGARLTWNR